MKKQNPRHLACILLKRIFMEKTTFNPDTISHQFPHLNPSDHNFTANLIFGVLRWYVLLDKLIDNCLEKPLKTKDFDIKLLLLIGTYQLYFLKTPPHAAVNESVAVCQILQKIWAKGLINAVLKKLSKCPLELNDYPLAIKTAHPAWLANVLEKDWGEKAETILQQNNQRAPLFIRVNAKKISREAYLILLQKANIAAVPARYANTGIKIQTTVKVNNLPGYQEGLFSVQDASAQLAAFLLDLQTGQTVLDACAAPGGKTTHLLEITPAPITLYAVEKNPTKLSVIEENLARLQLSCHLIVSDAALLDQHWQAPVFDRILLDPPCSGTGVIRRHPDIKILRHPADIRDMRFQQANLLKKLWPLLKPNGILVYSTCSILKSENVNQIVEFLNATPDAMDYPIEAEWGVKLTYGRQLLPGEDDDMDGFYYARLTKAG